MNYNSLHATGQAWGGLLIIGLLGVLVYYQAWGALMFIGTVAVGGFVSQYSRKLWP